MKGISTMIQKYKTMSKICIFASLFCLSSLSQPEFAESADTSSVYKPITLERAKDLFATYTITPNTPKLTLEKTAAYTGTPEEVEASCIDLRIFLQDDQQNRINRTPRDTNAVSQVMITTDQEYIYTVLTNNSRGRFRNYQYFEYNDPQNNLGKVKTEWEDFEADNYANRKITLVIEYNLDSKEVVAVSLENNPTNATHDKWEVAYSCVVVD